MAENPLIAQSESQENPNPITHPVSNLSNPTDLDHGGINKATEGAGIFSDAASTWTDARAGNWGGVAMDAGADALDALGMAMDPLGSLAGAGIGWLIEHISFLKRPLDILAGDPEAVTAKAQTLDNISQHLTSSMEDYNKSATGMQNQKGSAASGYQKAAADYQTAVKGVAGELKSASSGMRTAATVVGTTRGIVRDSLSQFAGDAIVKFFAADALAPITFGASEAVFIADEVAEGVSLGTKITSKLTKVVEDLKTLGKGAEESKSLIKDTGEALDKAKGAKGAEDAAKGSTKVADAGKDAKPPTLKDKVDDFNKRATEHNDNIGKHGDDSVDFNSRVADHNKRAVDNETKINELDDKMKANRESDNAQANHSLGGKKGNLVKQDKKLGAEQQQLEHEGGDLKQHGTDLKNESNDLVKERQDLRKEEQKEAVENFHNHGVGPFKKLHEWVEGQRNTVNIGKHQVNIPTAEIGHHAIDYGKEAGVQSASAQQTRNDSIRHEYQDKAERAGEVPDGGFVESSPSAQPAGVTGAPPSTAPTAKPAAYDARNYTWPTESPTG